MIYMLSRKDYFSGYLVISPDHHSVQIEPNQVRIEIKSNHRFESK